MQGLRGGTHSSVVGESTENLEPPRIYHPLIVPMR